MYHINTSSKLKLSQVKLTKLTPFLLFVKGQDFFFFFNIYLKLCLMPVGFKLHRKAGTLLKPTVLLDHHSLWCGFCQQPPSQWSSSHRVIKPLSVSWEDEPAASTPEPLWQGQRH